MRAKACSSRPKMALDGSAERTLQLAPDPLGAGAVVLGLGRREAALPEELAVAVDQEKRLTPLPE